MKFLAYTIKDHAFDTEIVLDVRVRDEHGRLYDIEVRVSGHPVFPNRVLYYWPDTYLSQRSSGSDYKALSQVISIILTEFTISPQLKNLHNVFQLMAREKPDVMLADHLQIHFVRLSDLLKGRWKKLEGVHRDLRNWTHFFVLAAVKTEGEMSSLTDNDQAIREAYAELQRFYANTEMHEHERRRHRFLLDYNLGMDASKAEGKADDIVRILTRRFNVVPGDLVNKLYGLTNLEELDRLFDFALDCNSLDEFQSAFV